MRRFALLLASALAVASLAVLALAAEKSAKKPARGKPITVEGTLIDAKCFSIDPANRGDDHPTNDDPVEACAEACAKLGIPVAVLTAKGEAMILLAPAPEFTDHMSDPVRVSGTKAFGGKAILVEKAEVRGADGAWKELSLHTMM